MLDCKDSAHQEGLTYQELEAYEEESRKGEQSIGSFYVIAVMN